MFKYASVCHDQRTSSVLAQPPFFLKQGLSSAWNKPTNALVSLAECCNHKHVLCCFDMSPGVWTRVLMLAQHSRLMIERSPEPCFLVWKINLLLRINAYNRIQNATAPLCSHWLYHPLPAVAAGTVCIWAAEATFSETFYPSTALFRASQECPLEEAGGSPAMPTTFFAEKWLNIQGPNGNEHERGREELICNPLTAANRKCTNK